MNNKLNNIEAQLAAILISLGKIEKSILPTLPKIIPRADMSEQLTFDQTTFERLNMAEKRLAQLENTTNSLYDAVELLLPHKVEVPSSQVIKYMRGNGFVSSSYGDRVEFNVEAHYDPALHRTPLDITTILVFPNGQSRQDDNIY